MLESQEQVYCASGFAFGLFYEFAAHYYGNVVASLFTTPAFKGLQNFLFFIA